MVPPLPPVGAFQNLAHPSSVPNSHSPSEILSHPTAADVAQLRRLLAQRSSQENFRRLRPSESSGPSQALVYTTRPPPWELPVRVSVVTSEEQIQRFFDSYPRFYGEMSEGFPGAPLWAQALGGTLGGLTALGSVALGALGIVFSAPTMGGLALGAGGVGAGSGLISSNSIAFGSILASLGGHAALFALLGLAGPDRIGGIKDSFFTETRIALEAWQEDPNSPFDYSNFLWRAERYSSRWDESESQNTEEIWQRLASRIQEHVEDPTASTERQIELVLQRLFINGGLSLWRKGQATMSGLFRGEGGNCVAGTNVILAAICEAGITLEEPEILALQLYKRHLRLVVYNRESGEVWNLISGERSQELTGPLYHLHLLLHSFLVGQGQTPPTEAGDFLLAGNPNEAAPDIVPPFRNTQLSDLASSSPFQFPEVEAEFSSEPIPEAAVLPMPRFSTLEETLSEESSNQELWRGISQREYLRVLRQHGFEENMVEASLPWARSYLNHDDDDDPVEPGTVVFHDQGDLLAFNNLTITEEQRSFILQLSQRAIVDGTQSPMFEALRQRYENPLSWDQVEREDVRNYYAMLLGLGYDFENIDSITDLYENSRSARDIMDSSVYMAPLIQAYNHYHSWAQLNPERFLNQWTTWDPGTQRAMMYLDRLFSNNETEDSPLVGIPEVRRAFLASSIILDGPTSENIAGDSSVAQDSFPGEILTAPSGGSFAVEVQYSPPTFSLETALNYCYGHIRFPGYRFWNEIAHIAENWETTWYQRFNEISQRYENFYDDLIFPLSYLLWRRHEGLPVVPGTSEDIDRFLRLARERNLPPELEAFTDANDLENNSPNLTGF